VDGGNAHRRSLVRSLFFCLGGREHDPPYALDIYKAAADFKGGKVLQPHWAMSEKGNHESVAERSRAGKLRSFRDLGFSHQCHSGIDQNVRVDDTCPFGLGPHLGGQLSFKRDEPVQTAIRCDQLNDPAQFLD
jgi:hypothetical protein